MQLKPFIDNIEKKLENEDDEYLLGLILHIAKNYDSDKRSFFCKQLEEYDKIQKAKNLKKLEKLKSELKVDEISLQSELDKLSDDIGSMANSGPSTWDENDVLEGYLSEYEDFLEQASTYFTSGLYSQAKIIYETLIPQYNVLIEAAGFFEFDDYDDSHNPYHVEVDINFKEYIPEYIRSVWELEKKYDSLFSAIENVKGQAPDDFNFTNELLNISDIVLSDKTEFLKDWIDYLKTKVCKLGKRLYVDAVKESNPDGGLLEIYKTDGKNNPGLCLTLLKSLIDKKQFDTFIEVSDWVIENVRGSSSDFENMIELIYKTARTLNNKKLKISASEIRLELNQELNYFSDIIAVYRKYCVFDEKISYIQKKIKSNTSLLTAAYIIQGNYSDAYNNIKNSTETDFFRYNQIPLFIATVLKTLCRENKTVPEFCLNAFISDYFSNLNPVFWTQLDEMIQKINIKEIALSEYLKYVDKSLEQYLSHILSNKLQSSYINAARFLCGRDEAYYLAGRQKELLLPAYIKQYSRFTAFRKEINAILEASKRGNKSK